MFAFASKGNRMPALEVNILKRAASYFSAARDSFAKGKFRDAVSSSEAARRLIEAAIPLCQTQIAVSVIIVSYQHEPDTAALIKLIAPIFDSDKWELVFVNNGNPHLLETVKPLVSNFKYFDLGFNYGCAGGRNIGARLSAGEYILFLDDDGLTDTTSLQSLAAEIDHWDAVAVRGRVRNKSAGDKTPPHYDLGDKIIPSPPNTEGISIWRRDAYLKHGGFDPLLVGYEGIALCCKMYPFVGPTAFLYNPNAVLRHNYAVNSTTYEKKRTQLQANAKYLSFLGINHDRILAAIRKNRAALRRAMGVVEKRPKPDSVS